jgi:hypothetical protein
LAPTLQQTRTKRSLRRRALHRPRPRAISDIHVMSDVTSQATAPRRFQTTLLTLFSTIALFLAVIGVYGLLAYSVR